MTRRFRVTRLLFALSFAWGASAVAADVDFQRLLKSESEPDNWMTYHGGYKSWHYSALADINAGNVKKLGEAWSHVASRSVRGLQSYPLAVDGVLLPLRGERAVRAIVLRDDQHAGGVLVDPVHDPGPKLPADAGEVAAVVQERVHQRPLRVARGRVHDHARGLVDHHQVRVLEKDRERDRLRRQVRRHGLGHAALDALAGAQLVRGLGERARDSDLALLDQPLHLRARQRRLEPRERDVEALARELWAHHVYEAHQM